MAQEGGDQHGGKEGYTDDAGDPEAPTCDHVAPCLKLSGQHDREENQDGDGADVDEHLCHRDKLRFQQQVEGANAKEAGDQPESGVNDVAHGHGHHRRADDECGHERETHLNQCVHGCS